MTARTDIKQGATEGAGEKEGPDFAAQMSEGREHLVAGLKEVQTGLSIMGTALATRAIDVVVERAADIAMGMAGSLANQWMKREQPVAAAA